MKNNENSPAVISEFLNVIQAFTHQLQVWVDMGYMYIYYVKIYVLYVYTAYITYTVSVPIVGHCQN
jgi:hypothetical protein